MSLSTSIDGYDGAYKSYTDWVDSWMDIQWIHTFYLVFLITNLMIDSQMLTWVFNSWAEWTPFMSLTGRNY